MIFSLELAIAQGSSAGGSFLRIPSDAVLSGLATSGSAWQSDKAGFMLNPAVLKADHTVSLGLSTISWMHDTRGNSLWGAWGTSFGSFAVILHSTSVSGIEIRTRPGDPEGHFTSRTGLAQITYATAISNTFRLGISAKLLYQKIFVNESTGESFDIGLLYSGLVEGLSFSASLSDLGSMDAFRNDVVALPTHFRMGSAYTTSFSDVMELTLLADMINEIETDGTWIATGAELSYDRLLYIRTGFQNGAQAWPITFGAGVRSGFVRIDYGYIPMKYSFGSSHLLSIMFIM